MNGGYDVIIIGTGASGGTLGSDHVGRNYMFHCTGHFGLPTASSRAAPCGHRFATRWPCCSAATWARSS